jgi:hypothetical protein
MFIFNYSMIKIKFLFLYIKYARKIQEFTHLQFKIKLYLNTKTKDVFFLWKETSLFNIEKTPNI